MAKNCQCDLMVIGGGIAAAATALAAAAGPVGRGKAGPAVCWVQTDPSKAGDVIAADYAFINPAVANILPSLKTRLARLTDGAVRGLDIFTAHEGRHAEFVSRSLAAYLCDGAKLFKGLLAMCRQARVTIINPPGPSRFLADDHAVRAVWPGGQCSGSLALLADLEIIRAGQADGLGFRSQWLAGRTFPCLGQTFAVTPARLNAMFGRSRRIVTAWSLAGMNGDSAEQTAPTGHDGHAWVLPKGNSVSVGCILGAAGESPANPQPLMASVLSQLRAINALPRDLGPASPVHAWQLPVAAALDIESHAGKRSRAVGLAGGFVSALSGQWIYPVFHAATTAAAVAVKALADPRPQDVISQFGARWRHKLSDYLRSPNTRLAFLLPLVFGNRQIASRFARAYLFGENF